MIMYDGWFGTGTKLQSLLGVWAYIYIYIYISPLWGEYSPVVWKIFPFADATMMCQGPKSCQTHNIYWHRDFSVTIGLFISTVNFFDFITMSYTYCDMNINVLIGSKTICSVITSVFLHFRLFNLNTMSLYRVLLCLSRSVWSYCFIYPSFFEVFANTRTHDPNGHTTQWWRHFDVKATSFWRHNDVISASCVRWDYPQFRNLAICG